MTDKKKHVISIRLDEEEKVLIDKKAESYCMTVSQYLRYRLLEEEQSVQYNSKHIESKSLKFLDNNLPFLYRMMIKCMMKIERLAERKLSIDDIRETNIAEYDIIKQLGITKEEEGNFTKEERKW